MPRTAAPSRTVTLFIVTVATMEETAILIVTTTAGMVETMTIDETATAVGWSFVMASTNILEGVGEALNVAVKLPVVVAGA
jgi:hypothetical protein